MQLTKSFVLQEFIPKSIYAQFGDKSVQFLDPRLPILVQEIRNLWGKSITINNWNIGGTYHESGFRHPTTGTGATLSQHKFGRAGDLKSADTDYNEFRQFIRDNFTHLNKFGLTTIELGTSTWLHIDMRWIHPSFHNPNVLYEVPFR